MRTRAMRKFVANDRARCENVLRHILIYIKNPRWVSGEMFTILLLSVQIFRYTVLKYMFRHTSHQWQCIVCKFRGNIIVVSGDPFSWEWFFFIAHITYIYQTVFQAVFLSICTLKGYHFTCNTL